MVHLIRRKTDGMFFALKRVPLDKDATDETRAINNEVRCHTLIADHGKDSLIIISKLSDADFFPLSCPLDPSTEKFESCECRSLPR